MKKTGLARTLVITATVGAFTLMTLGGAAYGAETKGPLTLKKSFFKGWRFSENGSKPTGVYGFTGLSFKSEFERVIATCPEAHQEARKAFTGNAISLIGSLGFLAVSIKMFSSTMGDVSDVNAGRFPDSEDSFGTDIALMASAGAVMIIGGLIAKSHLKKSVKMYNAGCGARGGLNRTSQTVYTMGGSDSVDK